MSILRKFLLPFSLLYGLIIRMRNWLYDKDILHSVSFSTPVIVVGNLSVGGTGKTPMIEYLLDLLLPQYKTATLSRGYGRKTRGYIELQGKEAAQTVGDEPLQFRTKYPNAIVVVDEDRRRGISKIISEYNPQVVLLDDAYQHRKVKAGFNILLTSFDNIYAEDLILPAGNLREPQSGARRANIIVVTKCPETLDFQEQEKLRKKLKINENQQLFFSYIQYGDNLFDRSGRKVSIESLHGKRFTLVTGIAKPEPLLQFFKNRSMTFDHRQFPDHHNFSEKDLETISEADITVTTEKDFMRLRNSILYKNFYYIPIRTKLISREKEFEAAILDFVNEK